MLFLMASESVKVFMSVQEGKEIRRNVRFPRCYIRGTDIASRSFNEVNGFYAQLKDRNEMSQEIRHVMAREQQHPQKFYK